MFDHPDQYDEQLIRTVLVEAGGEDFRHKKNGRCPFHGDKNPSGSIFRCDDNGVWRYNCFGCGVGGDIFDLREMVEGKTKSELLREGDDRPPASPRVSNGDDRKESRRVFPSLNSLVSNISGTIRGIYPFPDPGPIEIHYVPPGKEKKTVRPVVKTDRGFEFGAPKKTRQLFGAPRVLENEKIVVVEGPKCVEALQAWGIQTTTWSGGCKAYRSTDFKPLAGKDVTLWPDNDQGGINVMRAIGKILLESHPGTRVRWIDPQILGLIPTGDVADLLDDMVGMEDDEKRSELQKVLDSAIPFEHPPESDEEKSKEYNLTDEGNAERMRDLFGKDFRYVSKVKAFYSWAGVCWEEDENQAVRQKAIETVRNVYKTASEKIDQEERGKIARHALRSESNRCVKDMLESFSALVSVKADVFDCSETVNFKNLTLDLKAKKFREHRREDLCSKVTSVAYNEKAKCPRWEDFLLEIMNDDSEMVLYLKKLAGYALTPFLREHVFPVFYGTGGNGKSVYVGTLLDVFGDYGRTLDPEMLLVRNYGNAECDRAEFYGVRLAVFQETESGKKLNESFIKAMTGGDRITARKRYGHPFNFNPTHTPILCTNHKPQVYSNSNSIWRRLRLVPFNVEIPEEKRDSNLQRYFIEKEGEGIMKWIVDGLLGWLESGLETPRAVDAATNEYRDESDTFSDFLKDYCERGNGLQTKLSPLRSAYELWCKSNGYRPLTGKNFTEKLKESGFSNPRDTSGRWWEGLELNLNAKRDLEREAERKSRSESNGNN